MIKINRIYVEGFRGITSACTLSLYGKSLLLFGENGTGKSSFVDALERLFTGKVSTLEGRMGVSTEHHGPNIRISGQPKISVDFSDNSEFNLETDIKLLPPTVKDYLIAAQQPLYILRRRQILNFIESKPQERYDQLRPFLPLTEVEETETALRSALQKADTESTDAERSLNAASRELAQAIFIRDYQVPVNEQQVCTALSVRLQAISIAPLQSLSNLGEAISALDVQLSKFGNIQTLITLHSALTLLAELQSLNVLDFTPFRTAFQALRSRELTAAKTFFEDVLQRGLEWIQTDWTGKCPLCETPWDKKPRDRDVLVARIHARLDEMKEIVRSRQETDQIRRELLDSLRKLQDTCKSLQAKLETLGEVDGLKLLDSFVESLQNLQIFFGQRLDQIMIDRLDVATTSWHTASYPARLQELITRVQTATGRLPSPEEIKPLVELRSLLDRIDELWHRQEIAFNQRNLAHRGATVVSTMVRLAEEARKEEVQEIFDQISKDLDNLYERATGKERSLSKLRLEIRPEVRGSVIYQSDFYDQKNVVPNAYGSDAQLDMIGLCTFLALQRWYRKQFPDFNLLILDDVLTSVDTQHAVRTAELILKEFGDYQIILTTHDRIWYEYLRDIQARCRVKGQFLNKVIHKWTLEEGPDLREPEEERERLDRLLMEGEVPQIAVESGRLLEHILQEMRYSLRLSVQAKRGELYEIGEIWPAFYSEMRKSYSGFYGRCGETLDAIDIRWTVRNWVGSHFNQWASRVSREDALEFGRTVSKLFDCVFCKDCRRFIKPSMAPAGQLSCRCGNLIYPAPGKEPLKPLSREEIVKMTQGALRDAQLNTDLYFEWKRAETGQENN
jgi:hypothetical protein